MRSMKRPRKPVHRYKSLLFPGIALLAVFAFWAAFDSPKEVRGETELFEYGGLKIEITNVREIWQDFSRDGGPELWEYPVYTVYPGATATVLEADMKDGSDGVLVADWAFARNGEDWRLDIVDGMEPLEIVPDVVGVFDPESSVYVLRFVRWDPQRGETVEVEKDGLKLEISSVHHVGGFTGNFDLSRPLELYDTYYIYPGGKVTVLEAPPAEDGTARWELRPTGNEQAEVEPLRDGMAPIEFAREGSFCVYDLEESRTAFGLEVSDSDQAYWK